MSMSRRRFVGLALSASGAVVLGARLRAGETATARRAASQRRKN
jgi:hypothetical protein